GGADVINMSTAPECALASEAGLPYAAVAMATDYDAWKEDEAPVTWDEITRIFAANVESVVRLLVRTIAPFRGVGERAARPARRARARAAAPAPLVALRARGRRRRPEREQGRDQGGAAPRPRRRRGGARSRAHRARAPAPREPARSPRPPARRVRPPAPPPP